jgi:predicted nuclease of restriction endonuclease-like (RecB) superfamily
MIVETYYNNFIKELKQKIYNTKSKAILSANRLMIELYFEIGKEIVIKQETLGWGKSVVEQMSKDLVSEFGEKSGYSSSNLWRMRNFYLSYKDNKKLAQLVREISWGQNILIFEKCKDDKIKEYYLENSIEFGWNRNVLMHHIKTNLFDRDKKENKTNNFEISLPPYLSELARDIIKSEYNLEFLEVAKNAHERAVENVLIDNIKQPEYAGKMNFYLNLLNDTVKMPHENPSIGIILCTDKDKLEVEYALQNVVQPMGISTYTVQETFPKEWDKSLPTKEELEQKLKGGFSA